MSGWDTEELCEKVTIHVILAVESKGQTYFDTWIRDINNLTEPLTSGSCWWKRCERQPEKH